MNRRFQWWLITLLTVLPVAHAHAADFNIKVPVRMYNMVQGVGKVKVTCEIMDAQGKRIAMASKWSQHGVNQYPAGLEEDITVSMNAYNDKDPRTAAQYVCDLKIQTAWVQDQPWQTPSKDSASMFLKPKPGTEFRVKTSGSLYATGKPIAPTKPHIKLKNLKSRESDKKHLRFIDR